MTLFTETKTRQTLQTAWLKWFISEEYSFEQETALANCAASQAIAGLLDVGTVMGRIMLGAWTIGAGAAGGGNVGNATVAAGSPAYVAATIQAGTYRAVAISATEWEVYDPFGKLLGLAADTVAFSNQIAFTITHGATPAAAGDIFTFAVTNAAGSGKVVPVSAAAVDGSAVAMGVVVKPQTVPSGSDAQVVLAERLVVGLQDNLIWPSGATSTQIAGWVAQLAAAGIINRAS